MAANAQACAACRGSGNVQQLFTVHKNSSMGLQKCKPCKGSGKPQPGQHMCSACRGYGEVMGQFTVHKNTSMGLERCKPCDGAGALKDNVNVCSACRGYGKVMGQFTVHKNTSMGLELCKPCDGAGALKDNVNVCRTCRGYGSVQNPDSIHKNEMGQMRCKVCSGKGRVETPAAKGAAATVGATGSASNVITGYHQTSEASAQAILKNGFQPGKSGIAGGGIYFAMNPADTQRKAHQKGAMLKAQVDVGSAKIMTHFDPSLTLAKLRSEGFDSVFLPAGDGVVSKNEYVIYEAHRVISVQRA